MSATTIKRREHPVAPFFMATQLGCNPHELFDHEDVDLLSDLILAQNPSIDFHDATEVAAWILMADEWGDYERGWRLLDAALNDLDNLWPRIWQAFTKYQGGGNLKD